MDRRTFIGTLTGGLLAAPLAAEGQQPSTVARVGFLYFGSRKGPVASGRYTAFLDGMRELGYVEGQNFIIEARFADSKPERVSGLAADLVRSKVEVIVATGSPIYRVLQRMAAVQSVVVTVTFDPVIEGLAERLARPGGKFTGLSDTAADLGPKQLDLIRAVLPRLSRLGLLLNPGNASHRAQMKRLMLTTQEVGVQVVLADAGTAAELEPGFASLARARAEAVILFGDTFFTQQFPQITAAALTHRLPSIYITREYAETGGLMSYGADITDNFRRAAMFVDKILKGARPAELPFEQPTRFYLVINLKTARALGLTIPPSLLARADQVIE